MNTMTVPHGGVRHRTSTPHKRGNKVKVKKKLHAKMIAGRTIYYYPCLCTIFV